MGKKQLQLYDFTSPSNLGKPKQSPEEKRRRRLIAKTNKYFEEAFRLLLESSDSNSIDFRRIFAYIIRLLRKMEEKEICYVKNMNGRLRVLKKILLLPRI